MKLLSYYFLAVCSITIVHCLFVDPKVRERHNVASMHRYLVNRQKRFIVFDKEKENKDYQKCTAIGGRAGHCKYIPYCQLKQSVFQKVLDHLCIIESVNIGVCCPDDLGGFEADGANIVYNLPSTGDSDVPDELDEKFKTVENRGCGLATNANPKDMVEHVDWPWMAALMDETEIPFCGGVLITERHVLSAAHCLYNHYEAKDVFVKLGEYDFDDDDETRPRVYAVKNLTNHKDYDPATYDNDIAILELERSTIFNTYIWPICLPPIGSDFTGKNAIVAGWGTQGFGGPTSGILMEISIPIWDMEKCRQAFTQPLTDKVICAAGYDGGKDSCQGDSGGPLMSQLPNGRWVNVGIVSWGVRCGEKGRAGIYTKVNFPEYLEWIADQTQDY
ncbi:trypsin-1-like [Chrysoperla carnea]|uniref:trypsin-1-like n=1 Tax=Chrysoperla carnea TaxID=189513 RepID=UPI001D076BE5|nr:trypsin-1-like [Chrysoperla carnea]